MDFDNLHQVLRNLYEDMIPLCGDMIGVAKGLAGLGALFYVAYRVWQALARAEPIDVFPLLRPFAIGLCILFFPTIVLGTINAVMSPIVRGTHSILETQTFDMEAYQLKKEQLEYEARVRDGKAPAIPGRPHKTTRPVRPVLSQRQSCRRKEESYLRRGSLEPGAGFQIP